MISRRSLAWLILLFLIGPQDLRGQSAPKLASLFPLGGEQGTTVDVEIRGVALEGTKAVWLGPGSQLDGPKSEWVKGSDGLKARVQAVQDGSRMKVRLVVAPDARAGFHNLSLLSPRGVSGSIRFWVGPHAVIEETAQIHNTAATAQPVKLPVAVNGRITAGAELDYYAFDIARAQTVAFDLIAIHGANFDPQLALYEAGGSFLDPQRSKRLLFHEEITQGSMPASRRMTHHFSKPGRYVVNVGNVFAQGGGEFSYLLQIIPEDRPPEKEDSLAWARRRMDAIRSRSVGTPTMNVRLVSEAEPNDRPEQARDFEIPAVLEGTICRPEDIDCFRFKAKAGQKLAFEIQTPRAGPPHFNVRLDVLDAKGAVALTNLQAQKGKIGTVEDAKVIQIAPHVLGTLDKEGEYCVRIRDLTSIHGSPDHAYRVLVRPQVPHLGDISMEPAGPVNLRPGARQRLTLKAPAKEGYADDLALSVEGTPQGVRAFVDAKNSVIELLADTDAPLTPMPQVLRIWGLPAANGKSGSPFLVSEIPVMVLSK
jgi:hypothetical protein